MKKLPVWASVVIATIGALIATITLAAFCEYGRDGGIRWYPVVLVPTGFIVGAALLMWGFISLMED